MIKEYTCIICPNGCEIEVDIEKEKPISIKGASCKKGEKYVKMEIVDPRRTITTSVLVENGVVPLVSIRLTNPIPKAYIFKVMDKIKSIKVKAPIKIGQVIVNNIFGLGSDLIATKNVKVSE
ncbi:DUF1667 domain-containing protein [Clostridium sp. MT-14]|uniref:DUF1667 domain-containing protein n=2 Tax=Clostridium TaxID=1485 RepID=A0ABV4E1G0_9CLOT|nr:DUF1667 domain-containing protein [Clostridium aromativorans]MCC9295034.1 DUF1667 domain-containing protein [Clostridium aromativorans]